MTAWQVILVLLGICGLTVAGFGFREPSSESRRHRRPLYAATGVASLILLAATAWLGWSGPGGGPSFPQRGDGDEHAHHPRDNITEERPRDELATDRYLLEVAEQAVQPDNRGSLQRVEASPASIRPERVVLILRANDAENLASLREQILRDAWAIFSGVFGDRRLGYVDTLRLIVTHPSGGAENDASESTPPGEPIVAEIETTRERFQHGNPTHGARGPVADAEALEELASVRWLPPLRPQDPEED